MTVLRAHEQGELTPSRHSALFFLIAVASAALAVVVALTTTDRTLPVFADVDPVLSSGAIDTADELLSQTGHRVERVDEHAAATLAGYYTAIGTATDTGWRLSFDPSDDGTPLAIERSMAGAYAAGQSVERVGDFEIVGTGPAPALSLDAPLDERVATLAAIVELGGSLDGRLATLSVDRTDAVMSLARSVGLEPRIVAGASTDAVVLDRVVDRATVADWTYGCLDRVPLVGERGCAGPGSRLAYVDPSLALTPDRPIDAWIAGITGPLDRTEPHWLTPAEGAVGWTNGEAQQYRDTSVTRTDERVILTASPHPEPRVDRAPFDSGMVISQATFGWGLLEVDVTIPVGGGLWPAVWLLDAEACVAPGMCDGYDTPSYHEIDLLETSGDTEVSTSVHWFDERLRSASTANDIPTIADGGTHTIAIDRRPGLLIWSIDGVEIDRMTGPATADEGPHRAAPMRLVVNLAVGGTLAGDRLLGPTSPWWGSSMVPAAYPDLGWSSASMTIVDARFTALDDLLLG
ncbi:MAG: glycoside hydrolase family 16 protein [Acidimicrobiales bacterium]